MFYYLIEKHMQKFRHFWREKNFTRKKSLKSLLHQAIQLHAERKAAKAVGMEDLQWAILIAKWINSMSTLEALRAVNE